MIAYTRTALIVAIALAMSGCRTTAPTPTGAAKATTPVETPTTTLPVALDESALSEDARQVLALFQSGPFPDRELLIEGTRAFTLEHFGGNGRTCETCHSLPTGTFSLEQARARFAANPDDPLFRPLDSDHGDGQSYQRLLRNGTVSVRIPLPPGVKLADDTDATEVVLFRGTPSFRNVAGLDPILMHDGRAPDLQAQALDAIQVHAENRREPTQAELDAIAHVQRGDFTSPEILAYANGGPPPGLPEGNTASEKRGRAFFVEQPVDLSTGHGICAICHSGPLLDTTNEHIAALFPPVPLPGIDIPFDPGAGWRLFTNGSAEENRPGLPVRQWLLQDNTGNWLPVSSPDIGFALAPKVVGVPERFADVAPAFRANIFKISSLRFIAHTAPYFHNNGAATLEEVVGHYDRFFRAGFGFTRPASRIALDEQAKADIVAYLRRL